MGMNVLNTLSGFTMTRSIVAIYDITIWLQRYFLFLTTMVESLTSSNMSSPAFSFKSSTTWDDLTVLASRRVAMSHLCI
jgi:hypothetical protein